MSFGMDGPNTSASISPTRNPSLCANATARFTAIRAGRPESLQRRIILSARTETFASGPTGSLRKGRPRVRVWEGVRVATHAPAVVDFPTPPLPLATAITCLTSSTCVPTAVPRGGPVASARAAVHAPCGKPASDARGGGGSCSALRSARSHSPPPEGRIRQSRGGPEGAGTQKCLTAPHGSRRGVAGDGGGGGVVHGDDGGVQPADQSRSIRAALIITLIISARLSAGSGHWDGTRALRNACGHPPPLPGGAQYAQQPTAASCAAGGAGGAGGGAQRGSIAAVCPSFLPSVRASLSASSSTGRPFPLGVPSQPSVAASAGGRRKRRGSQHVGGRAGNGVQTHRVPPAGAAPALHHPSTAARHEDLSPASRSETQGACNVWVGLRVVEMTFDRSNFLARHPSGTAFRLMVFTSATRRDATDG